MINQYHNSRFYKNPIMNDEKAHRLDRVRYLIETLKAAISRTPKSEHNAPRRESIRILRRELDNDD